AAGGAGRPQAAGTGGALPALPGPLRVVPEPYGPAHRTGDRRPRLEPPPLPRPPHPRRPPPRDRPPRRSGGLRQRGQEAEERPGDSRRRGGRGHGVAPPPAASFAVGPSASSSG